MGKVPLKSYARCCRAFRWLEGLRLLHQEIKSMFSVLCPTVKANLSRSRFQFPMKISSKVKNSEEIFPQGW